MDLKTFRTLLNPAGQDALAAAHVLSPREPDFLRHFQDLSRRYPRDLARAALEIAVLRGEARTKFPFPERLYLTRTSLQQATPFEVATYRAERYRPFARLADLGCSVGGDTLALASVAPTLGLDRDPLRLAMAQANLAALDLADQSAFAVADLTDPPPLAPVPDLALFFDPARREEHQRVFSVHYYQPPLAVIQGWLPRFPALGVKLSPGVKLAEIQGYPAELEFTSLRGDLKEAALWFGPLQTTGRRATLLPGPHTLTSSISISDWLAGGGLKLPLSEPRAYLYEPDPAVLRAGLVADLGQQLAAAQLDPDIAYLTADQPTPTPFARCWEVADWFPFGLKRLRAYLRERNVGRVVVKKRGSPLQPEELIRKLRLQGDQERTVFLTHLRGRPIVIFCR